ncbi:LolA family protein [Desulfomarina sp.]
MRREISRYGKISAENSILQVFLFFLLFLPLSICMPVYAGSTGQGDLQPFLEKIQKKANLARSFSADFTQEKILTLFARPVHFKGKLYIVRPDRLRWEFISPVPSALIFRGEEGLKCSDGTPPHHFNLAEDPVMKVVADQLWLWLGGDYMKMADHFTLRKTGNSTLKVIPVDKNIADFISSVTIVFDEKTLQPRKVEITEAGGDLTRIVFYRTVINGRLDEKLFSQCDTDD